MLVPGLISADVTLTPAAAWESFWPERTADRMAAMSIPAGGRIDLPPFYCQPPPRYRYYSPPPPPPPRPYYL
jgi:hypothetical protein